MAGKSSALGIGKSGPDAEGVRVLPDGCRVPMGKAGANKYAATSNVLVRTRLPTY
jgi:hypothetical protein